MLTLALLLSLGQARVQPIPACAAQAPKPIGRWSELGGWSKAVSADPTVAKVRVLRGHVEVMGLVPGWAEVTLTHKAKVEKVQVCVYGESGPAHCGLCGVPMALRFSSPPAMEGTYPDLATWRRVRTATARTGIPAPPPPPELAANVVAAANEALTGAGVRPRLRVVAGLPVLDPMPVDAREDGRTSAALAEHLPVLLELLGP